MRVLKSWWKFRTEHNKGILLIWETKTKLYFEALKGFRTFETCFCWWMYNSCCTIRTTEVLTLCKTLCSFMTYCCGLLCWHPFTLHGTQSITNRKWQRRSPEARANWLVDLNRLDQLISSPVFAWSWRNFLCDTNGQSGCILKRLSLKVRNPFK